MSEHTHRDLISSNVVPKSGGAFVAQARKSADYIRVVNMLRALPDEDAAHRAFAEATHESRLLKWAKQRELKRSDGHACIARLLGRRCMMLDPRPRNQEGPPCTPPGADHSDLWIRGGKPVVYTTQPYQLSHKHLVELVEFCNRWGLEVKVDTWPGGHFPGSVLWIEIVTVGRVL